MLLSMDTFHRSGALLRNHPPSTRGVTSFLSLSLVLFACSSSSQQAAVPPAKAKPLEGSQVKKAPPKTVSEPTKSLASLPWAKSAYSPKPGSSPEPALELAVEACGRGDAALHEAALVLAREHEAQGTPPDLDFATFHMRRLGSPYVMPRLWSVKLGEIDEKKLAQSISAWAKTRAPLGEFRCGAGLVEAEDGSYISVLQVDVSADIQPIALEIRSGEWIDFEAHFLTATSGATVLLLPPDGPPRRLNPKVRGDKTQTRFAIETSGTWLIQLMATQSGGPRPVAQILVTADNPAPSEPNNRAVPGEEALDEEASFEDALFALMNAARESHGLPVLRRNRKLDRLARAHSLAMSRNGRISHNTGQGDPERRIAEAGLSPKATGENVARANSVLRLHRVLWSSPAHRENLLLRRWDEVGVAVFESEDGALFASQLFIDSD